MASSKIIKICKVESESFAKYCIMRGVDYLGVHVLEFVLDVHIQRLCTYIQEKGGHVVLLTKERDAKSLRRLIAYYRPWGIQLHYAISPTDFTALHRHLSVPLIPVFTDEMNEPVVSQLIEMSEFAIYDTSFRGGTGTVHPTRHLVNLSDRLRQKVLLAGGIDPEKITETQGIVGGFDIQSYCRVNHRPHYGRLEQVICAVKGTPRRQLSVSLTDLDRGMPKRSYPYGEALEYQLDYSVGNLYPDFKVDSGHVDQMLKEEDAPYTLHIFERKPEEFQRVIDRYRQLVGSKLVRINIQYSPGLDLNAIRTYDARLCVSLYYDDVEAYEILYPRLHDCLSLILPSDLTRKQRYLDTHKNFLDRVAQKEVWFDRKVDEATTKEVLRHDKSANFIVGRFVLSDWSNEAKLANILKRGS
jgi:phosphoribosylanthranilate isomerase